MWNIHDAYDTIISFKDKLEKDKSLRKKSVLKANHNIKVDPALQEIKQKYKNNQAPVF